MRRRFFVQEFANGRATLSGDSGHHLGRVLRAEVGQLYELSDGNKVNLARAESVNRDSVDLVVVGPVPVRAVKLDVTLLVAVIKFDRMEWALEKATELGVGTVVPLAAARCIWRCSIHTLKRGRSLGCASIPTGSLGIAAVGGQFSWHAGANQA